MRHDGKVSPHDRGNAAPVHATARPWRMRRVIVDAPVETCPKQMVHGPCGGVRSDLSCEVGPLPCPFARLERPREWAGEDRAGTARAGSVVLDQGAGGAPVVLTDLTTEPYDRAGTTAVLAALRGSCDAVLVADHQDQPDFPPTLTAAVLRDAGVPGWLTLTCRDRDEVALEQELAGLSEVGVDGVLCVTGDARGPGARAGAGQVFDLDGTRLAARAAAAGLPVAVAEAPEAPPTGLRPGRLRVKQQTGAHLGVLNHVNSAAAVAAFAAAARAVGVTMPIVAGVAVYTDERSAAGLLGCPGLHLDPAAVARVLAAPDPRAAGIAAAVAEARELLAVPGVVGVNLSGRATAGGGVAAAQVKAEIGTRIREMAT